MRVAISGSHRTGKSTLLAELSRRLPTYTTVDEPYLLMEEDGYEFSHPPSLEDFEAQLERSIQEVSQGGANVLFDRCPIDLLGYIAAHEDADAFDFNMWIPRSCAVLATLDLIVFVPIESRDRSDARVEVDRKLKEILFDDPFELGVEVLEVEGDLESRVRTVLQRMRE